MWVLGVSSKSSLYFEFFKMLSFGKTGIKTQDGVLWANRLRSVIKKSLVYLQNTVNFEMICFKDIR